MEEGECWQISEVQNSLVKAEDFLEAQQKMVKRLKCEETEAERGADVLLVFRVLLTLSSKQGYF